LRSHIFLLHMEVVPILYIVVLSDSQHHVNQA
jgi:hypothetical protein